MTTNQVTVGITVVPRQVELVGGMLYLYEQGALRECGPISCLRDHIEKQEWSHVSEHFDGTWSYPGEPQHVVRSDP
jgi:hypothetical protein